MDFIWICTTAPIHDKLYHIFISNYVLLEFTMHWSSIQTKKWLSNLCVTSPLIHTGIHVMYMKCIQYITLIFTYLILLLCYIMIDYKLSLLYAQFPRKLEDTKWADCQSEIPRWQTLKRSSPTRSEVKQIKKAKEKNKKSIVQENDLKTYTRTCWALKYHTKKRRIKKN